jgi:hypothetical protein
MDQKEIQKSDGHNLIKFGTDGKNHQVTLKGDAAKGLIAAASALFGFTVGFLLNRRY